MFYSEDGRKGVELKDGEIFLHDLGENKETISSRVVVLKDLKDIDEKLYYYVDLIKTYISSLGKYDKKPKINIGEILNDLHKQSLIERTVVDERDGKNILRFWDEKRGVKIIDDNEVYLYDINDDNEVLYDTERRVGDENGALPILKKESREIKEYICQTVKRIFLNKAAAKLDIFNDCKKDGGENKHE